MLYNKKIKPLLVDQNIIGEYMKEKMISQMKTSGVAQQSELQKLLTKIFYNIVNFVYHYFFILLIFIIISYYLYKRYVWYQEIKTKQSSDKIKKYFDDIMDGTSSGGLVSQVSQAQPVKLNPALHGFSTKSTQPQAYFGPSKKIDKVMSSNNGHLTHLKQTFDVAKPPTTSMGRLLAKANKPALEGRIGSSPSTKTVRFAQGDFDAYGRNNINPKTGETLVKQLVDYDDQIQPYDSRSTSGYSMFQ